MMKVGRTVLIGVLVGSMALFGSAAHATPDPKPVKPRATKGKPTTTTSPERDRLRVTTRQREQDSRLSNALPGKPRGTKPAVSGKPPREDRTQPDARHDIRMHVGNCNTAAGYCWEQIRPDQKLNRRPIRPVVRSRPQDVTWDQVRSETKEVTFPGLSVKVQPNGRTLVNLDTIVYTEDSKVSTTTVTLLGFPVEVEATPISYTWNFGDGSPALTTSTPGKPYPSKEITHKYMKRGAVSLTLTTSYAARFNVAGTGWQYVDGIIPVTGPATPLQVREAVPVLVDPGR
jgi:hypothetical protein